MAAAVIELPMSIPRIHEVLPEFRDCPPLPPSSYPPSSDWSAPLSASHSPCPVQPPVSILEYNRETNPFPSQSSNSPTQHNPFRTYSNLPANQYILHPSQHDGSSAQLKAQLTPAYSNSSGYRDFGHMPALSPPPGRTPSLLLPSISSSGSEYFHSAVTEPQIQAYNHQRRLGSPIASYGQPKRDFPVGQGLKIFNPETKNELAQPSERSWGQDPKVEEKVIDSSNNQTTSNSTGSSTPSVQRRGRRSNLPRQVTNILQEWLREHSNQPYPTVEEKQMLMQMTSLSLSQISNWFINARRRRLNNIASYRHAPRSSPSRTDDSARKPARGTTPRSNRPDTAMKEILQDGSDHRMSDGDSG